MPTWIEIKESVANKEAEIIKSINDTQFSKGTVENKMDLARDCLGSKKEIMAAIKLLYDDVGVII
uniref:Uncharacterized protein n=1 Tax=Salmonella sp. TaxID=599 RepID=A0A482EXB2_SALSP|nr:hypothetical protein [Salmonella sp.]QBM91495.1 hypothetical protein NNIBIDOC_00166 [Salmonella sp.]